MKKMTCRQMGGTCDDAMTANNPEEMIGKGMEHVKKAHPEMLAAIEAMPDAEMKTWREKFDKTWSSISDSK
jgi:predicted small metal-binding protein